MYNVGFRMKIYLDMTGCRLNQAELELMAAKYASLGHELIKAQPLLILLLSILAP